MAPLSFMSYRLRELIHFYFWSPIFKIIAQIFHFINLNEVHKFGFIKFFCDKLW